MGRLRSVDWTSIFVTVATAVLAMKSDLHWLLVIVLAVASVPIWRFTKTISAPGNRTEVFIFLLVACGYSMYAVHLLAGDNEPYQFKVRTAIWVGPTNDRLVAPIMMGRQLSADGTTLFPVNLLLVIELLNNQDTQSKITSYYVDVGRTARGPWKRLMFIPSEGAEFFGFDKDQNLALATEIRFGPGELEMILRSRSLTPHETVSGLAFVEMRDYDELGKFYRFHLSDTAKTEFDQIVATPRGSSPKLGEVFTQDFLSIQLVRTRDISKFKRGYFYPN